MSDTRWSARKPVFLGALGLPVLLAGFGTWSVVSNIAGAIIAPGRIEVDRNRQVVQRPDGGVVSEIRVDEGDNVDLGDVLIRLDSTLLHSQLVITEGQLLELMARRARLEAERDEAKTMTVDAAVPDAAEERPEVAELVAGQRRLFDARLASLAREIGQLEKRRGQIRNQIDGIKAQQASLKRQIELIGKELVNQQSLLDRGLALAGTVLNLERAAGRRPDH